ncbi:MAG: TIGR00730 family Rossman fold protein [Planctomycetaceae bacterium]|nr:TIGR00730 family Rossman fold protein [Planctomycetaceae bacterium]
MNNICVFCGSKFGNDDLFRQSAHELGDLIAQNGKQLVYGGGSVGLMGVVADAVLENDGHVIGVIPERLATEELLHAKVPDMRVTADMHARKATMAELADVFIALPGGYGTFEELFEIITWAQLGFHRKPIGLLNIAGFYDPLIQMIDQSITAGFIKSDNRDLIVVRTTVSEMLDAIETHELPQVRVWNGPQTTPQQETS